MAWGNVPICNDCWERRCDRNGEPGRVPVCVAKPDREQCGYCGLDTKSGIYVRDNTSGVPFPPKNNYA